MKLLIGLIKFLLLLVFGSIVVGRLFFPQFMQNQIISPVRKIPVLGQVLGVTWDKSSEIMPSLTQKTVRLADQIEYSDLGINEAMEAAANDKNISQSISGAIEKNIQQRVSQLKDVPKDILNQAEQEIRNEIYMQICAGWQEATVAGKSN